MVAVAAFIAFLIGLIIAVVNGVDFGGHTFWMLLGLTLLALSRIWDRAILHDRRDA